MTLAVKVALNPNTINQLKSFMNVRQVIIFLPHYLSPYNRRGCLMVKKVRLVSGRSWVRSPAATDQSL